MLPPTRTEGLSAPGAVVVSLWLTAWCRGAVGADDLLGVLAEAAPDTPALVVADTAVDSADELLRRLRATGAAAAWPVLPRPGRTLGWPPDVTGAPQAAALLVDGDGQARLLLRAGPSGWVLDATQSAVASPLLGEALSPRGATRQFTALLEQATTDLARLGLDRAPSAAGPPRWEEALVRLPRTLDPGCGGLLHRIARVLDALELALADDGAAVTAGEARARASRLWALHGALVDLVTAACVGVSAPERVRQA